jgi:hypothetical protein
VVALTVAGLGYYNGRVTGDPLRMPYQIHEATYAVTPLFLWQPLKPEPSYRHAAIAENQLGWSREEYLRQQSLSGWAERAAQKCGKLLLFYLGIGLLVPVVALRLVLRDRWMLFAALACAWQLAAMLQATWVLPHYAAPVTGLLYALAVGALRYARLWGSGERRPGRAIVPALVLGYAVLIVLGFVVERRPGPDDFPVQRTALLARLEQSNGRHLVLVRYQPKPLGLGHDEWVYNGADIDRQKVVWARAMGPEEDRRLIEYFQDRQIWLLEADQKPPRLTPYGEADGGRSMATIAMP